MVKTTSMKPVTPRPAASILLIRNGRPRDDGFGRLEVLMVRRHSAIRFGGGTYVFPGGKVDQKDNAAQRFAMSPRGDVVARKFHQSRLTALRETFEETGLLLASSNRGRPLSKLQQQQIMRQYRWRFLQQGFSLSSFIQETGLQLAPEKFVPFAHWVTPLTHPKRFDTTFFLCEAPLWQQATPDGHEIISCEWARPHDLLVKYWQNLMFPTVMNLQKLGRSKTVEEALSRARRERVLTVMPEVVSGEEGVFRKIRDDAGYEPIDQIGLHLHVK